MRNCFATERPDRRLFLCGSRRRDRACPTVLAMAEVKPVFVRAMVNFDAKDAKQLSFKQGDSLRLISSTDVKWWEVELNGKTGLVPATHVQKIGSMWTVAIDAASHG